MIGTILSSACIGLLSTSRGQTGVVAPLVPATTPSRTEPWLVMSPPLPETGLCMSTVCHAANGSLPALRKCWNCPWHCLHERGSSR
ncbi:hypothetical protein PF010_g32963 [Phytophthora fragariae]|uniref:Uncharacterized protein n=1 Tax=Phytophthora fragariae TaxID=53985 RepID=A0A6G0JDW7_9STRA|nr:hypothetical protein PF010_g32963 [Phytophthora fragariae]